MTSDELTRLTATEAADLIGRREITSLEYCDALIAQCETGCHLNAFSSRDWEALRQDAQNADAHLMGQLMGVPIVFKDNIETAMLTTTAGTGVLTDFRPGRNAPIVSALFAEGTLLGGKGNMHELAFGITTNNAVTGASRNPHDPAMIPGGSSGGVAVAVAAHMMPAGIGTDTGASIRLPAALCGCVGFRPTVGRYDNSGIVPISRTRDTAGPITRSVADVMLLDSILSRDKSTPSIDWRELRLGVPRQHFYADLDPEVAEVIERTLQLLSDAGIDLVDADLRDVSTLNTGVSAPVARYEFTRCLMAYIKCNGLDIDLHQVLDQVGSADVRQVLKADLSDPVPETVYRQAIEEFRPALQELYADYFRKNRLDAVIFPTSPLPARLIGQDETVELNGRRVPTFDAYIRNVDPASNAGIPGISIPAGLTASRLPVGIEIDGPAGSDTRLLAIAHRIEKVVSYQYDPSLLSARPRQSIENRQESS